VSAPIAWTVGLDALPPTAVPPDEAKEPLFFTKPHIEHSTKRTARSAHVG